MKRTPAVIIVISVLGLVAGCSWWPRQPVEPPPLPPIDDVRPPLTMKGEYFKAFPWKELPKIRKDESDPNASDYTFKDGDTLESVAERFMGSPAMAADLAEYNQLPSRTVPVGQKIVIPHPIVGVTGEIVVKAKGEKAFGSPQSFTVQFKKGDQYKMRFVSNVNGHLYVLRQGAKGVDVLYPAPAPAQVKRGKRGKRAEEPLRATSDIKAYDAVEVPSGAQSVLYDSKRVQDRVFVFLSLKPIPALEDLRDSKKIKVQDVEDVMLRVNAGEIYSEPPYHLLRISDPNQVLGFSLNING